MKEFVSQTRIALANPEAVIAPLCEHMMEHGGQVDEHDGARVVRFDKGRTHFVRDGDTMVVIVASSSLEGLYAMRSTIASHILEYAEEAASAIEWTGDGRELTRPPNFQILTVVGTRQVTPRMRRLTLSGAHVSRFAPMAELHLKILIQHPELARPQWPTVGRNGLVEWEDVQRRPLMRKYTVRSLDLDAGTLDIDFVLHADSGPGAAFAEQAGKGDAVGVVGPGGGGLVDADWHLFAGDETALPAIARMLEHLPEGARGKAFIEIADEDEIQAIESRSAIDVKWLCRNGAAAGTKRLLLDAVRETRWPNDGSTVHVWAGCEFETFRAIRSHLRQERGLKREEHLVVAFWRIGRSEGET